MRQGIPHARLVSKDTRLVYNRHRQGSNRLYIDVGLTGGIRLVIDVRMAAKRSEKPPAFSRLRSPATYLMASILRFVRWAIGIFWRRVTSSHVGVGVGGGVGNKLGASERDDLGNKLGASASDGDELGASEEDELGDELGARMAMRLVHRKETNWAMSLAHWMAMNLA